MNKIKKNERKESNVKSARANEMYLKTICELHFFLLKTYFNRLFGK